jgi:class 3 adenylate cyclase
MFFGFDFLLKWRPGVEEFTAPLAIPPPFQSKLDRFAKGIDNAHIDVILSARLMESARQLLRAMIKHDVNETLAWGWDWVLPPAPKDIEGFQQAYAGVMEAAIGTARQTSRRELVQLVEFAVLKFLLVSIGEEIESFREELQQQRGYGQPSNRKAEPIHDRLAALAREVPALHRRVADRLFAHILKVEATTLRRLRKSLLGRSWPVPREMLFNPVLRLASLWHDELFMRDYPLVGANRERLEEFAEVNQAITGLFADYLPDWAQPPALPEAEPDGKFTLRLRTDQGTFPGFLEVELLLSRALREDEFQRGRASWLDDPANLDRILRSHPARQVDQRSEDTHQPLPMPPDTKQRSAFRAQLLREAQARFKSLGLLKRIIAAQAAPTIFDELHGQVPVRLIIEYLEGDIPRRKMAKRLASVKTVTNAEAVLKRLEAGETALRRLSPVEQGRHLIDFMARFAALRRDLKLAYRAYWCMNRIRLLTEPSHIELARSNRTLHEFVLPEEQLAGPQEIRGHAILKADLRGSSRIIKELRGRNLNPATHFSLNFFGPINGLLERFGARKVFVEGDAVILSLYEYQDAPHDWLALCRAAGLARKILDVVDAQNAQNRKYDLPELELGLGIAWLGEAPAFLHDGDHEIMISSAINRADRLSSCAASLRMTSLGRTLPRGVEVVVPVEQGIMQKDSGDNLLRYNVNGIELDPAAFPKLRQELVLHQVELDLPQYAPSSVFHVGRYPDRTGLTRWLIVREAPVRRWVGDEVAGEDAAGRRFYEVVTCHEVMAKLKEKLAALGHMARQEAAQPGPPRPHADSDESTLS